MPLLAPQQNPQLVPQQRQGNFLAHPQPEMSFGCLPACADGSVPARESCHAQNNHEDFAEAVKKLEARADSTNLWP